jgi:hypothetical protein
MGTIEAALAGLEAAAVSRVLRWAFERFEVAAPSTVPRDRETPGDAKESDKSQKQRDEGEKGDVTQVGSFGSLAEFYDAASPSDDKEKALVVCYWRQFTDGVSEIDAQSVSTALKHLGHALGNVTRTFDQLKAEKPASIVQLKKEGTSRQARKKFKVTSEGKKRVERMLAARTTV